LPYGSKKPDLSLTVLAPNGNKENEEVGQAGGKEMIFKNEFDDSFLPDNSKSTIHVDDLLHRMLKHHSPSD